MKSSIFNLTVASVIAIMMTGCGGGGGGSSTDQPVDTETANYIVGQFIDSPVKGLKVKCSSDNFFKVTDEQGKFQCKEGDSVTFYIGEKNVGTAQSKLVENNQIFSPYDIFGQDSVEAVRLAQLLQTLDHDNNPENGIVLDENIVEKIDPTIDFNDDQFENRVESIIGKKLVDIDDAWNHMDRSLGLYGEENVDQGRDSNMESDDNIDSTFSQDETYSDKNSSENIVDKDETSKNDEHNDNSIVDEIVDQVSDENNNNDNGVDETTGQTSEIVDTVDNNSSNSENDNTVVDDIVDQEDNNQSTETVSNEDSSNTSNTILTPPVPPTI